MGRQRVAARDKQRKKRKLKRERRCQSTDDAGAHGVVVGALASDGSGGTAAAGDAGVGRSGKRRRRRLRQQQQAAAADRGAQPPDAVAGHDADPEGADAGAASSHDDGNKLDQDDSKSRVDAAAANAPTGASAAEPDKGVDAARIERMRLQKQQRKAARDAKRKKVQRIAAG